MGCVWRNCGIARRDVGYRGEGMTDQMNLMPTTREGSKVRIDCHARSSLWRLFAAQGCGRMAVYGGGCSSVTQNAGVERKRLVFIQACCRR